MHELAIADRIVERAAEAAREHGADRVDGLTIELGAATHLAADQLRFCIETIAEDTPVEGADLAFERVPARGSCDCGWRGELRTLADTVVGAPDRRCPDCGGAVALTAGRECRLATVRTPEVSAA
jgi:hydrogenase nickel incorporation protein HypA/HybF